MTVDRWSMIDALISRLELQQISKPIHILAEPSSSINSKFYPTQIWLWNLSLVPLFTATVYHQMTHAHDYHQKFIGYYRASKKYDNINKQASIMSESWHNNFHGEIFVEVWRQMIWLKCSRNSQKRFFELQSLRNLTVIYREIIKWSIYWFMRKYCLQILYAK